MWIKLGIGLDRKVFCQSLDDVRNIRNDVMHFDPDGVPNDKLVVLREFVFLLKEIREIRGF